MTRTKSRQNTDVCADCGAPDPSWASINKGIFLCIQCCSIHRSLGRHISQVKSFQKSSWSNSQLAMVQNLNNSGVNNIWEHAIENNSKFAKRKPTPKDPLHVKAEFIRAKHQNWQFAYRPNNEDGLLCVENELGKELHASVRSSNLEASLRLLIQGADPNYFHDEKGSTPLHVAAKANQITQAELLITYGADPTCLDAQRRTPIEYAKQQISQDLANRLIECQYEVTDKFSNYLCHRKPEHEKGVHFLIPQIGSRSDCASLGKLKKLPNKLFEELVMDVYDEVERRETEAIWLSSAETLELNANAVPFLPVDPSLSTTRNQGRQKLGRFTTPELKALVYDILVETQRRQLSAEKASQGNVSSNAPSLRQFSQISDDEPLYDSVASDDDYAFLASDEQNSLADPQVASAASKCCEGKNDSDEKVQILSKKLQDSTNTITDLKAEVSSLKSLVEQLSSQNYELRTRLSQAEEHCNKLNGNSSTAPSLDHLSVSNNSLANTKVSNGNVDDSPQILNMDLRQIKGQRPTSMYETREGLKTYNWQMLKNQVDRICTIKETDNARGATQSLYAGPREQIIMQYTEQVTKGIQQLWNCINSPQRDDCVSCAEKINLVITHLTAAVPTATGGEVIQRLLTSSMKLKSECSKLQSVSKITDSGQIDYYLQQVRLCAYEIAKDTKALVTRFSAQS